MKNKNFETSNLIRKALILFVIIAIGIVYIPFNSFAGNDETTEMNLQVNVTYAENNTTADVTFDASNLKENYTITKIGMTDETTLEKSENTYKYNTAKNGSYEFIISYTDGTKDDTDKFIEKTTSEIVEVTEISEEVNATEAVKTTEETDIIQDKINNGQTSAGELENANSSTKANLQASTREATARTTITLP